MGMAAAQIRTGNSGFGGARSLIGSARPSAVRLGHSDSSVTNRASTWPCSPYWLQAARVCASVAGEYTPIIRGQATAAKKICSGFKPAIILGAAPVIRTFNEGPCYLDGCLDSS